MHSFKSSKNNDSLKSLKSNLLGPFAKILNLLENFFSQDAM